MQRFSISTFVITRAAPRGFTLVEIMIVVAIIALLAAIAIPNVLRGRMSANETAAIGNMRALVSSLEMYRSSNNAYPTTWSQMTPAVGVPFYPQPFQTLAATVQGYTYTYTYGGNANTYNLTASPQTANNGGRSFFIDQTALMRHCAGTAVATATAVVINAPPGGC